MGSWKFFGSEEVKKSEVEKSEVEKWRSEKIGEFPIKIVDREIYRED